MQLAAHTFESGEESDFNIKLVKEDNFELEVEKVKLVLMPKGKASILLFKDGIKDIDPLEFDSLVIEHKVINIIIENFMKLEDDETFYIIGDMKQDYKDKEEV